jgi:hypothetical protein
MWLITSKHLFTVHRSQENHNCERNSREIREKYFVQRFSELEFSFTYISFDTVMNVNIYFNQNY